MYLLCMSFDSFDLLVFVFTPHLCVGFYMVLPLRRRLPCAALHPVALRAALRTALRRDRCSTSQSIDST